MESKESREDNEGRRRHLIVKAEWQNRLNCISIIVIRSWNLVSWEGATKLEDES